MASEASINCSIVVESKSSAVVDVCKEILAKLEEYNFDKDDTFAVHLTLEEAFLGFEPESVDDPRFGEGLYEPGGRGLLLMNSYMDVVKYSEHGNSVYMVRYKEKPGLTDHQSQTHV